MPRKYKRKPGVVPRHIGWTESDLAQAFEVLNKKEKGFRDVSRQFGISVRTLRRRYEQNNQQILTQGKYPVLGFENEKRLVNHIIKLGEAGFPPERKLIRQLAYQFAEKLKLNHNFNKETQMAGKQWLQSFLERNPAITLRQAEGLSLDRAKGLNREEVANFFSLLTTVLTENDLLDKPDRIFNMDETGVQLNNKPGKVLAKKGTKAVKSVTAGEKGETISIIACCNAVGNFLPPVLILKGVKNKPEFENGLPPGSKVYMNKKSAYISSELFYKWLTEHFIVHKPQGKVLLILDGHSAHSSSVNMLEAARDNDVILLCLPSHTTSALQPLDKSVFGPFKKFFNAETSHFMRTSSKKKLNRYNSGQLIGNAWIRAATPANAISGFRSSGIYPANPNALSEAEFTISEIALGGLAQECESDLTNDQIPGVSRELTLNEPTQESESQQNLAQSKRNQMLPPKDRVPGVTKNASVGDSTQKFESEQRLVQNNQEKVRSFRDQVRDVSGEPANQSIAPNNRDQARPTLSAQLSDDSVNLTLTESTQEIQSKQRLTTNIQGLVSPLDVQNDDDPETEKISVNQNQTPLRPSSSLLNLSQDCLAQIDMDIENYICNGTELSLPSLLSLNESNKSQHQNIEKETPSKFLHQSSPIPKIPLSIAKRVKQNAEVLNSDEKIEQKKNKEEKTKATESKIMKASQKGPKRTENKPANSRSTIKKKRGQWKELKKNVDISSSETEFEDTDLIRLKERRALRKRQKIIYSSDSEDQENQKNIKNIQLFKGKYTKGLQIKKSKDEKSTLKNTGKTKNVFDLKNENVSIDNFCVECFENYNFTTSKSDWIACDNCRMWLHETCTSFKKYCMRCGKLKALAL